MNLWVKSLRQLCVIAAALFFFSCENENSFLGYPTDPKNQRFDVSFVEIPLKSSMVLVDSLVTDNKASTGVVNVGGYFDPAFGHVTASPYLNILPVPSAVIPAAATYDSVTVKFRFNYYSYGFTGDRTIKFNVHQLTDTLARTASVLYDFNDAFPYNPDPMASLSVSVRYDSLKKQFALATTAQDTLIAHARLPDAFGQTLFTLSKSYPFSGGTSSEFVRSQYVDFINKIKGFAVIPTNSEGILGIKVLDGLSNVTVYYHADVSGTNTALSRSYFFSIPSFTNITVDRSTSILSGLGYYQNTNVDAFGPRYVQSGSPVVTKLDLENFYAFADTVENVIVNEAKIVIGGAQSTNGLEVHSSLGFKLMKENNQFMKWTVNADSAAMRGYYTTVETPSFHYFVASDVPSSAPLRAGMAYDSDDGTFSGYLTLFVQTLLTKKEENGSINPNRLKYLAIYPNSPTPGYSLNRTIFDASQVKLRIYYTKPRITVNQ